jgi:hypothetical protein
MQEGMVIILIILFIHNIAAFFRHKEVLEELKVIKKALGVRDD